MVSHSLSPWTTSGEVLVEDVAHDADDEVGLGVQQHRAPPLAALVWMTSHCACRRRRRRDLLLGGALGGGADDDARVVRDDLLEDLLQALALDSGSLRLMPVIVPSGT
jgi:hypothetical protein